MPEKNESESKVDYPRRHHYIPKFYLAGFNSSGKKNDFLFVLDKAFLKKEVKQKGITQTAKDLLLILAH